MAVVFIGVLTGALLVDPRAAASPLKILWISLPALLVSIGGYMINDYYDIEADRISKPWRPLARGAIDPDRVRAASLALMIFSAGLSASIGVVAASFVILNAVLAYAYSWRLKKLGLVGNVVVAAMSANTILFGGLAYSEASGSRPFPLLLWLYIAVPWIFAFAMSLSREIVKGIEDVEGDRARGVRTLAVSRGHRIASLASAGILVALIPAALVPLTFRSSIPYLVLALFSISLFLMPVLDIVFSKDSREALKAAARARSYSKISLLAGTIAFLLWALS